MKRFAQILWGKAHWIFEAEEAPNYAPDFIMVDITNMPEVKEGWVYDEIRGVFTEPYWDGGLQPVPEATDTELILLGQLYQTRLLEILAF